jgi:hypothetical protein
MEEIAQVLAEGEADPSRGVRVVERRPLRLAYGASSGAANHALGYEDEIVTVRGGTSYLVSTSGHLVVLGSLGATVAVYAPGSWSKVS